MSFEPQCRELIVSQPIVCWNNAPWGDRCLNKRLKAFCRCIGHVLETNSPNSIGWLIFHGDSNQSFSFYPSSSFAFSTSTDVSFVNLNFTRNPISSWSYHSPSQFVQPYPRCFITTWTNHTLKPKRIGSVYLIGNMPHHLEPQIQWFSSAMKNCTCSYGGLEVTCLQCHSLRLVCHAFLEPHFGHIKPSGHLSLFIYSRQADSVENHFSNSANVPG